MMSLLNASFSGTNLAGNLLPFDPSDLDNAYGTFTVLAGGTLVSQDIAKYPFANQSVAANATIRNPLAISVIMDAPMRGPNPWAMKQMIMSSLKSTLDNHNNSGGLYTVLTPAFMYDNLVMVALTDTPRTTGSNPLPQNAWKFDFEKPLITLQDAAAAQNQLMSKISNGTPTDANQTGAQPGSSTAKSDLAPVPASATQTAESPKYYTPTTGINPPPTVQPPAPPATTYDEGVSVPGVWSGGQI